MSSKPDSIKKIRKMLKVPLIKDKVVCFIPEWEIGGDYLIPLQSQKKEYVLQEQSLFPSMINRFLFDETLSFFAFEGKRDDDARVIYSAPGTGGGNPSIDKKSPRHYGVKILCIDYKFFEKSISYNFFRYIGEPILGLNGKVKMIDKDMPPLFELFGDVSMNTRFAFKVRLEQIIEKIERGEFSDREQDLIEFYSKNHIQNLFVPNFWHKVRDKGFLCEYNKMDAGDENKKIPTDGKIREDIRFFYTFESLIYWELKNIFIKTKRCKNCNALLSLGMSSKRGRDYCPEGSPSYEKCRKQRQNIRSADRYRRKRKNKV